MLGRIYKVLLCGAGALLRVVARRFARLSPFDVVDEVENGAEAGLVEATQAIKE